MNTYPRIWSVTNDAIFYTRLKLLLLIKFYSVMEFSFEENVILFLFASLCLTIYHVLFFFSYMVYGLDISNVHTVQYRYWVQYNNNSTISLWGYCWDCQGTAARPACSLKRARTPLLQLRVKGCRPDNSNSILEIYMLRLDCTIWNHWVIRIIGYIL